MPIDAEGQPLEKRGGYEQREDEKLGPMRRLHMVDQEAYLSADLERGQ